MSNGLSPENQEALRRAADAATPDFAGTRRYLSRYYDLLQQQWRENSGLPTSIASSQAGGMQQPTPSLDNK